MNFRAPPATWIQSKGEMIYQQQNTAGNRQPGHSLADRLKHLDGKRREVVQRVGEYDQIKPVFQVRAKVEHVAWLEMRRLSRRAPGPGVIL